MNELIDSGDPRAKVVGKRRPPLPGSPSLTAGGQMNLLVANLRKRPFLVKRGIYKFSTQEEADQWMMNLQVK
jgi:hypothetical protein